MKARVRLFAILREKVGTSELTLELPDGSTVADLMKEMARQYPTLLEGVAHTMVAINTEYVQQSHLLHDGDEVALIPPVSGGSPHLQAGDTL